MNSLKPPAARPELRDPTDRVKRGCAFGLSACTEPRGSGRMLGDLAHTPGARAISPKAAASKDASLSFQNNSQILGNRLLAIEILGRIKSGRSAMWIFLVMVYSSIIAASFTALAISAACVDLSPPPSITINTDPRWI